MQIVLEGPDNAGKSTLAEFISKRLGIPIQHSGGPSKYPGEVNQRTHAFNALARNELRIYDRHPAVSQNIYAKAINEGGELVSPVNVAEFYNHKPLIIYCRNADGLDGHVLSDHSSADYFTKVAQNYTEIARRYDQWAMTHANIIYRIGDSMTVLADTVGSMIGRAGWTLSPFDPIGDIIEFHTKFEQTYQGKPRLLPPSLHDFRVGFMEEETDEYASNGIKGRVALQEGDEADLVHCLEEQLDGLVDKLYVDFGTAYLHGFAPLLTEAWRRVHHANMQKVLATRANNDATDSGRDKQHDVLKPKGWEKPRHTDLVEDHAHQDEVSHNNEDKAVAQGG